MRKLILFAAMAAVTVPAAAARDAMMKCGATRCGTINTTGTIGMAAGTIGTPVTSPPTGVGTTAGDCRVPVAACLLRLALLHQRLRRLSFARARALATLDPLRRRFAASEYADRQVLQVIHYRYW